MKCSLFSSLILTVPSKQSFNWIPSSSLWHLPLSLLFIFSSLLHSWLFAFSSPPYSSLSPDVAVVSLSLSLAPHSSILFKMCHSCPLHPFILGVLVFTRFTPLFYNSPIIPPLSLPPLNGFIISLLPSISPSPVLSNSFTSHSLYLSSLISSPSNAFSFFPSTSLFPPNILLSLSLYLRYWSYKDRCSKESRTSKSVLYGSWHHSLKCREREEKVVVCNI